MSVYPVEKGRISGLHTTLLNGNTFVILKRVELESWGTSLTTGWSRGLWEGILRFLAAWEDYSIASVPCSTPYRLLIQAISR